MRYPKHCVLLTRILPTSRLRYIAKISIPGTSKVSVRYPGTTPHIFAFTTYEQVAPRDGAQCVRGGRRQLHRFAPGLRWRPHRRRATAAPARRNARLFDGETAPTVTPCGAIRPQLRRQRECVIVCVCFFEKNKRRREGCTCVGGGGVIVFGSPLSNGKGKPVSYVRVLIVFVFFKFFFFCCFSDFLFLLFCVLFARAS